MHKNALRCKRFHVNLSVEPGEQDRYLLSKEYGDEADQSESFENGEQNEVK